MYKGISPFFSYVIFVLLSSIALFVIVIRSGVNVDYAFFSVPVYILLISIIPEKAKFYIGELIGPILHRMTVSRYNIDTKSINGLEVKDQKTARVRKLQLWILISAVFVGPIILFSIVFIGTIMKYI